MAIPTAEVKERYGKHYLSFPDGEYELTPKDLHRLNMDDQLALKVIRRRVQYLDMNRALVTYIMARPHEFAEPIDLAQPVKEEFDTPKTIHLPDRLEHIFKSISQYHRVMEILSSEELIDPITHIWTDEKKGNKTYLVAILKDLQRKEYYQGNEKLHNRQIEAICKNTFGKDVSETTIKHTKLEGFRFDFIPYASTLP